VRHDRGPEKTKRMHAWMSPGTSYAVYPPLTALSIKRIWTRKMSPGLLRPRVETPLDCVGLTRLRTVMTYLEVYEHLH
jgi:hypothetical protein